MTSENSETSEERSEWKAPALVGGGVVLLWVINFSLLFIDENERGIFGDMFGAVNALFSGLAFAGVVYAILLQRKELKLQRQELALTRKELQGQRHEFKEQNDTLRRQRFENTFFQMLSLHNEIIDSMELLYANNTLIIKGRSVFKWVNGYIQTEIKNMIKKNSKITSNDACVQGYNSIYNDHQSYLWHYFRLLYRIIKFVNESDVEDKKFYTDIVRAQLSNQELQLLFYNCLTPSLGKEKFKPLVEKYALLNNLPLEGIHDPQNTVTLYDAAAYGGEYPVC